MHTAYIGLGSNLGDSLRILQGAWSELGKQEGITPVRISSPFRTEPVGMDSDRLFVNAAGAIRTSLGPEDLLNVLLRIEEQFGRRRTAGKGGYQDRILDLDLLLYDNLVTSLTGLEIPHPEMHTRLFVLYPLGEIAPSLRHPIFNKTMAELLAERAGALEKTGVEKITWPG